VNNPGEKMSAMLDELALEVVMVEPDDVQALGTILNRLDDLIEAALEADVAAWVDLCRSAKALAESCVLGEYDSPEPPGAAMGRSISMLQDVVREGLRADMDPDAIEQYARRYQAAVQTEAVEDQAQGPAKDGPVPADSGSLAAIAQDKELIESFIQEAEEHLGTIEVSILELENNPDDMGLVDAIFRPFHTIKGVSGFLNLSDINRLGHEVETVLDDARHRKLPVDSKLIDLVLDAVDLMKNLIDELRLAVQEGRTSGRDFGLEAFLDRLRKMEVEKDPVKEKAPVESRPMGDGYDIGDILVRRGVVERSLLEEVLQEQAVEAEKHKRVGEALLETRKVKARDVAQALREQKEHRHKPDTEPRTRSGSAGFLKVDTQKLDNMVDMVGELVIAQAILGEQLQSFAAKNKDLAGSLAQFRRMTSEIQRISMSMRMIPIKNTFQKMIRLVRDLSVKSGKKVNLEMRGEDTEIDRSMVDAIYDPLVHMVRNSVDHGIETPEVRVAAGKPDTGTVTLNACHRGGNIVVDVSDDGQGLNRSRIVEKALERGLIQPDANLSDQDVFALIFHPGFSTAQKVTDVSGRGVGMDVVKKSLEKMRGKVEVRSQEGVGATISMRLPLTLAVIDGIIVRAGKQAYIIPTISVVESIRPDREAYGTVAARGEMIKIRGALHPLIRLHELFGFEPVCRNPWEAIVVVAESDGERKCILVDEIVGKQEVVIKSLSGALQDVKGMAGGAILADGRVGIILDVPGLFDLSAN